MSFVKGSLIAFAVGFCVPILMAIAYWSFFEHHPSRFAQMAEPIGYLVCPPVLLGIGFSAYPILNGTIYLLVFSLFRGLKAIVRQKNRSG
ncbi:MAG TPA: hypothetical protein VHS13_05305 [Edaphobacter sp.]|jgi:hypothetical protein|nr:hypothetical protein [Edaphobacter sp.]